MQKFISQKWIQIFFIYIQIVSNVIKRNREFVQVIIPSNKDPGKQR